MPAGANLSNLDKVLKLHYLGPLRKQFYESNILLKRLQKNTEAVTGKNFTIPLHVGRNVGIGARPELGTLPSAGNQQYTETIVPMKYNYGKIFVSGQAIKATANDAGAFVRAVDSEIRGLLNDFKRDINRQIHNDGTGKLATCGTTSASTTVVVDDTRFLQVGMVVDIVTASTGVPITNGSAVPILTIPSSTTFTVAAAVTTSSSHIVTRTGVLNGTTCYELNGLGNIVSNTGTCQGIARSGNSWWQAQVLTNASNRNLDLVLMQNAVDAAEKQSGNISLILTDHARRQSYINLLTTNKRFVNTLDLDGGFKALEYNGMPLVVDVDIVPNTLLFLDESTLSFFQLGGGPSWMDDDGAVLHRTAQDAYEATLYWYSELGTSCCNKNVRLEKIN